MPKQKNISFVLAIFILVESTLLLVMQFAINPVFKSSKATPEISVSLKLPEMEGCVCPEITCTVDGDQPTAEVMEDETMTEETE